jgi:hypothetical protein
MVQIPLLFRGARLSNYLRESKVMGRWRRVCTPTIMMSGPAYVIDLHNAYKEFPQDAGNGFIFCES